jgi:hypothetical protein
MRALTDDRTLGGVQPMATTQSKPSVAPKMEKQGWAMLKKTDQHLSRLEREHQSDARWAQRMLAKYDR